MKEDKEIEQSIEALFRANPWHGVVPVEDAIAGALAYRKSLKEEDRLLYDEAICQGIYPSRAVELVEQASGREALRSSRSKPTLTGRPS